MPRRNAFQDWAQQQHEPAQIPESTFPAPPTPIDLMGMAKPKQRSREYEKRNRSFTYRLTDKELGAKIAAVAASLQKINTLKIVPSQVRNEAAEMDMCQSPASAMLL